MIEKIIGERERIRTMGKNFDQHISHVVHEMVENYNENKSVSAYSAVELPRKEAIIQILGDIRKILFPAYFGTRQITEETADFFVGDLLLQIEEKLCEQIQLAFRFQDADKGTRIPEQAGGRACNCCVSFLKKLPSIYQMVMLDVQAAYDGDPAAPDIDQIVFSYPGIFAISIYRIAHELYELGVPLIPRIMCEYAHGETGIEIHPGAVIGEHFFIDHGTGVVIGETVIIGDHVKLYQSVTLGALSTRGGQSLRGVKRHPTIKNNVTIYSGASVLGGETVIGENVTIGGNAFITESVPANTSVSMKNPELQYRSRKIKKSDLGSKTKK